MFLYPLHFVCYQRKGGGSESKCPFHLIPHRSKMQGNSNQKKNPPPPPKKKARWSKRFVPQHIGSLWQEPRIEPSTCKLLHQRCTPFKHCVIQAAQLCQSLPGLGRPASEETLLNVTITRSQKLLFSQPNITWFSTFPSVQTEMASCPNNSQGEFSFLGEGAYLT